MSGVVVVGRRDFLRPAAAVGGGLLLGVHVAPADGEPVAVPTNFAPNAFLRISPDESITIIVARTELGQGVYTALPMLIAEELEIDLDKVRIEPALVDTAYANPIFGMQMTGGSTSIVSSWEPLRRAGATAREMLITAAAGNWGVAPASCRAQKGFVWNSDGVRKLSYGQLAEAASRVAVPESPQLNRRDDFKLIGESRKRVDTPEKVNGAAKAGIDVRVPGMLTAVV